MSLTVSLGRLSYCSVAQLHRLEWSAAWQVQNALTRQAKEETVAKLEAAFKDSAIVYGMKFKDLNVSRSCSKLSRLLQANLQCFPSLNAKTAAGQDHDRL